MYGKMIVILSGVTGSGKSFLKKEIMKKLNFKNIVIVTTRKKRKNEIDGIDKHFVTNEEFEILRDSKKISVPFEFLGNNYAYYTEDLLSNEDSITELHYNTIDDFKKVAKNVVSIYIKPKDIEMAKVQLRKRLLPKVVEKFRLKEIKEQVINFEENKELKNKFDYIISNDYTTASVDSIIELINNIQERRNVSV